MSDTMTGLHVLWTEPHEEVSRTPDGEPRYCYTCRTARPFEHVVMAPVAPSCYGPSHRVACATCTTTDGDLFPGRYREWGEL